MNSKEQAASTMVSEREQWLDAKVEVVSLRRALAEAKVEERMYRGRMEEAQNAFDKEVTG